jgi:hypothetical protein
MSVRQYLRLPVRQMHVLEGRRETGDIRPHRGKDGSETAIFVLICLSLGKDIRDWAGTWAGLQHTGGRIGVIFWTQYAVS